MVAQIAHEVRVHETDVRAKSENSHSLTVTIITHCTTVSQRKVECKYDQGGGIYTTLACGPDIR